MSQIVVVPYEPMWASEFKKAKDFFGQLLGDIPAEIQHVGSTSVEGLWAKPILDIDIVVKTSEEVSLVIERLETVGYRHRGNLGIEGREAFSYDPDNLKIQWMAHHLYVCLESAQNYQNHIMLKSYLQKHPEAVKAYSDLKRKLADQYPYDIEAYIEGKTPLITAYLQASGMSLDTLEEIVTINQRIIVRSHEKEPDDAAYKYAVIMTRYQNQWVFVRHHQRKTWEIPGGKREPGESIMAAAKRELEEETSAKIYQIEPIGAYSVKRGADDQATYGLLFYAQVETFEANLKFEIEERGYFDTCPIELTYPQIQPFLFQWGDDYYQKRIEIKKS